ncbi:MAG: hypothetical protein AAF797_10990 [Planctomycetota bacterium]
MKTPLPDPSRPFVFTAFEPSGDLLAARLITELKAREPDRPVLGLGGEHMQAAGATLIANSTQHPAMLLGALSQIAWHRGLMKQLRQTLADQNPLAFIPTDSPAGNWAVCKIARKHHPTAVITHLVMPQLWAWAAWRIRRLRRLTDHVMCMLPFEPDWLKQRGVAGTFIGHPMFDPPPPTTPPEQLSTTACPKLALMPGSRAAELSRNLPVMLETVRLLAPDHPDLTIAIAARTPQDADRINQLIQHHPAPPAPPTPTPIVIAEQTEAVIDWADAVLVTSGTATLQLTARRKPMVTVFVHSPWQWQIGRHLISTRTFTLPNLISEHAESQRIIPEFVPHFGDPAPLADALRPLLSPSPERNAQLAAFDRLAEPFTARHFAPDAADVLHRVITDLAQRHDTPASQTV